MRLNYLNVDVIIIQTDNKSQEEISYMDNLKKIRNSLGLTLDQFSIQIGVPKSTYVRYENGKRSAPMDVLKKIAQLANIGIDEIVNNDNIEKKVEKKVGYSTIKLYPNIKASCANGSVIINGDNDYEAKDLSLPDEYLRNVLGLHSLHDVHAIIADGDSMEPTIKAGDIIFIVPDDTIRDSKVYILNIDGETYCKRVYKDISTGGIILKSDNQNAPSFKITKEQLRDIKVIGRVKVALGVSNL